MQHNVQCSSIPGCLLVRELAYLQKQEVGFKVLASAGLRLRHHIPNRACQLLDLLSLAGRVTHQLTVRRYTNASNQSP